MTKQHEISIAKIPNHLTGNLSPLDLRIVNSIPEGGNWKNIPIDIPSARLENIRSSFKLGKGSRSTYYGRLTKNMPSYTINTYFNRPGNGCHIHYNQRRVLSQREAARLQSFPDSFYFSGSQGSVNKQIGNAVPPLLAYQIAKSIGQPGYFIDLFCGAGGMGLGFKWAGWTPIVANDIDKTFTLTYSKNVHANVITGSITDNSIMEQLIKLALKAKKKNYPLWVLGGPPCQGFSTAGESRTMDDPRNHLFQDYKKFLEQISPTGFVFENVKGLLSMEGGKVFSEIKKVFSDVMPNLKSWLLNSVDYGIPQRRERIILIGTHQNLTIEAPKKITQLNAKPDIFETLKPAISVGDALSDLPPLSPNQDGSNLDYISTPSNYYQKLMRGQLLPEKYLELLLNDNVSTNKKKNRLLVN
jgi:DNA (cytosine-5)-methyltransferase 1